MTAEKCDRDGPQSQHESPEQQRAFVRAPGRRQPIVKGQMRVRVGRYVKYRKITRDEGISQTAEGDRYEDKLRLSGRRRHSHPRSITARGADHWNSDLSYREQQSDN